MIGVQLSTAARRDPGATAVVFAGRRLTFAQLEARACRAAQAMAELGLAKGERVAALLHNCNEFVELFFAAAKLGVIFVPLNFRLTAAELGPMLAGCAPSLLVAGEEFAPVVDELSRAGALPPHTVTVREPGSDCATAQAEYEAWIGPYPGHPPRARVGMDDEQLIVHSSGTTGVPKGAVWTHATTWFSSLAKIIDFRLGASDKVVVFGPLYHVGPLMDFAVPLLLCGGTLVLGRSRNFDPQALLDTLEHERATIVTVYPTLWRRVFAAPGIGRFDASALRILSTGGEPMSPRVLDAIYERFPEVGFVNTYGSTEGGPVTTFLAAEHRFSRKGSVGKPAFSVDVRIVDGADREVAPGEVGELTVRSPFVCKGYWRREDFTREVLRDGWWHTGDLAWRDADGFIFISGRSNDMIISGAENIYPVEVEQGLATISGIAEAAVIGAPDESWGERVVAFVVAEPGATLDAEQVRIQCRSRLAGYKVPREVLFVDSLPRNGTNKVDRQRLRRHYAQRTSAPEVRS